MQNMSLPIPNNNTADDATMSWTSPTHRQEREVIERAQAAWIEIKSGHSWESWKLVGKAMVIGRTKAMKLAATNKPTGKRYSRHFSAWLAEHAFADMDKGDRTRLFACMDRLNEIERWRASIEDPAKRTALNHPSTVLRHFKKATAGPDLKKPTKQNLRDVVRSLEEENHQLAQNIALLRKNRNGSDSLYTGQEQPSEIAAAILKDLTFKVGGSKTGTILALLTRQHAEHHKAQQTERPRSQEADQREEKAHGECAVEEIPSSLKRAPRKKAPAKTEALS
jgi:hypothetical protein